MSDKILNRVEMNELVNRVRQEGPTKELLEVASDQMLNLLNAMADVLRIVYAIRDNLAKTKQREEK